VSKIPKSDLEDVQRDGVTARMLGKGVSGVVRMKRHRPTGGIFAEKHETNETDSRRRNTPYKGALELAFMREVVQLAPKCGKLRNLEEFTRKLLRI
jgi:hypothetical protein